MLLKNIPQFLMSSNYLFHYTKTFWQQRQTVYLLVSTFKYET